MDHDEEHGKGEEKDEDVGKKKPDFPEMGNLFWGGWKHLVPGFPISSGLKVENLGSKKDKVLAIQLVEIEIVAEERIRFELEGVEGEFSKLPELEGGGDVWSDGSVNQEDVHFDHGRGSSFTGILGQNGERKFQN